jgi:hypothetical protein
MINRTTVSLNIKIDDAVVFKPEDTMFQNLVGIGGELLAIGPKKNSSITLQTFCGKSYARCPSSGLKFTFLNQGDKALSSVAQFIKTHSLYNGIGQHAIWSLTNGHRLTSIYSPQSSDISKKLTQLVASAIGKKTPRFHTTHMPLGTTFGQSVYNPTIEKYYVDISWSTPKPRNMHVSVYKENGDLFRNEGREMISGSVHKIKVELDPKQVPEGVYYVKLWDDENTVYDLVEVEIE